MRWIYPIWVYVLLGAFGNTLPFVTPTRLDFSAAIMFAYDGQNQSIGAYDRRQQSIVGYDAALEHLTNDTRTGKTGRRNCFADLPKFFAAKEAFPGISQASLNKLAARVRGLSDRGGRVIDIRAFGSRTRGRPSSDFDVAVIVDDARAFRTSRHRQIFGSIRNDFKAETGIDLDLNVVNWGELEGRPSSRAKIWSRSHNRLHANGIIHN